ncbi:MAG: hypothetical protein ACI4JM_08790 [Oscillospiraceae bacterium]
MDINEKKKSYDAAAKKLLSYKEILANILKYTVREFKDCSIEEIITCINGKPEIGTVLVDDEFAPKIDAAGTETVSENEGVRSFDIKFKVMLPTNEEAKLIINLESQNSYHPGYTLEKRGVYYLSRLISSQYNVEFKNSDFDKLKKVYSIWICTHAPKCFANTITEYRFKPENLVGKVPDIPQKYDLMSLIMINLGSKDENYSGLIRMLDILLNMYTEKGESNRALDILENDYNIKLRSYSREVDDMCNLSQGIYDDGIKKGKAEGLLEGEIIKAVKVVKKLLEKGNTLEEALAVADIDKETYEEYSSKEQ